MFFHFPGFSDFERAVTLLLVKMFLNFKNVRKAMSKLFPKPLLKFLFNEVFMPKTPCEYKYRARFAAALCSNREYLGGGRSVRNQLSSTPYLPRLSPGGRGGERVGGMSGGGGGCESEVTSTPVEICRWGGPVGLRS